MEFRDLTWDHLGKTRLSFQGLDAWFLTFQYISRNFNLHASESCLNTGRPIFIGLPLTWCITDIKACLERNLDSIHNVCVPGIRNLLITKTYLGLYHTGRSSKFTWARGDSNPRTRPFGNWANLGQTASILETLTVDTDTDCDTATAMACLL